MENVDRDLNQRVMMAQILDAAFPGLGHLYAGARRSGAIFLAITLGCLAVILLHAVRFARILFMEQTVHVASLIWIVALLAYALLFTIGVVADATSFRRPDRPTMTRLERAVAWSGLVLLLFLWGAL